MSDKTPKHFHGKHIDVSFDAGICSHGGDCVRNLPGVFDLKARPWINLEDCDTAAVINAVRQCPSGALQFHEACDQQVSIRVVKDGPLQVRGNVSVKENYNSEGTQHKRVALCRCGLSKNKPFCDARHMKIFKDSGTFNKVPAGTSKQEAAEHANIICVENGPFMCRATVDVIAADGQTQRVIDPALCRCGESQNKPFCDGSHNKINFDSSN
ncbi:MAG: CDGSH iron-sulfur domain-containing protein [Gammaproteobacteria bacterium]|nr:CDGSH iron-sulfur domain-containing protein [Gammaproteobacteria bacterium]